MILYHNFTYRRGTIIGAAISSALLFVLLLTCIIQQLLLIQLQAALLA